MDESPKLSRKPANYCSICEDLTQKSESETPRVERHTMGYYHELCQFYDKKIMVISEKLN